jgi:hypothetical protein
VKRLLPLLLLCACGPAPEVTPVELRLALDFEADALLEVYAASGADCAAIEGADDPADVADVHGVDRRAANGLNGGARAEIAFEALPADVELVFHARAVDTGEVVASACQAGIVIPAGGEVSVELVLTE